MLTRFSRRATRAATFFAFIAAAFAATASAQVTPAAGVTPVDDTQSIKMSGVIYTDFTFQKAPKITDADSNSVPSSSFNVSRAYITMNGTISHILSFRVTGDVSRETNATPSLSGSLIYRLKYGYMQVNLDDWMTKGSWIKVGLQQTPLLDYEEGIYRYRFQGTTFVEREGFFASSDAGVSFHTNLPKNYGDIHVGLFNGEGYSKPEVNNEKAFMFRGTLRPFAEGAMPARGLRVTAYYDADNYVQNAQRTRFIGEATFEHRRFNAEMQYLNAKDQTSITKVLTPANGWSMWVTPFFHEKGNGFEALFRYDHLTPNTLTATSTQERNRTIAGLAYWFPHPGGNATAALMLDYEQVVSNNFVPTVVKQQRVFLHGLINF